VGLEDKELKLELRAGLLDFLVGLLFCVASLSLGVGLRVASPNARAEAFRARKVAPLNVSVPSEGQQQRRSDALEYRFRYNQLGDSERSRRSECR